jgi:glycosyltransferase involved in cell wall biosynthesis
MGARVLMLLENNPYPQDTRVRNEAESLAAAGLSVRVLAPRGAGQPASDQINGVEVRRFRMRWARGSKLSYALEYAIAHVQLCSRAVLALARGARVIHFHGPPDTLFAAGLAARIVRRQVVFDLHDSGPELFAAKFGSAPGVPALLRAAQRVAIRAASQVIVTNETQRELVRLRGGCADARVSVVRNGPRRSEFPEPPAARAGRLADPRLIYVGALDRQDGVLDLAELLAHPELARARLTVVGDGPLRAELAARCRDRGVAARVTFTGQVPHAQVAALIWSADIGLDPAPGTTLNHGSTMIKVMEYMGAGRPLVAYDLRETRRSAGPAALYAPCGRPDALAELIAALGHDGEQRVRLGRLGRERAISLSWERSAAVLLAAYERLASQAGPRARKSAAQHAVTAP